jgi:hypothetical protein
MMLPKGLLDIFRKRPAIRSQQELAQFIDENAAFLVQKGIYEYSRARAGHYAKILFREPEFAEALDRSRWAAFPLGLAMVAEVVEGILRPLADEPANGFQFVDTSGCVGDDQWEDELHPSAEGFHAVAGEFLPLLRMFCPGRFQLAWPLRAD